MRKRPQQERSRQMVSRIITAATEVLRSDGYASFTTNKVADKAEISPGSLYQYFPDKHALLDEVVNRWVAEASDALTQAFAEGVAFGDPTAVDTVIEALVTALEADAALLRVVHLELPPAQLRDASLALERRIQELVSIYLAQRLGVRDRRLLARKAWVITLTVEQLVVRWVTDSPEITRDELMAEIRGLIARNPS